LAFTRDKATITAATPAPSASASASGGGSDPRPQTAATASASASASPAGGDLAATGSEDVVGWAAAAGVTAVAGGLLFLRRRDRVRQGGTR